ncbi:class IV lanthionine synthetase LanL [Pseudonocardia sp. GCM10023141]|uniref:class IV lanthionine synthetase LanL n=1 Tax=Pseudonocardia sp. GCM10023141 TaxID=3252653 RepID=UPI0036110E33
MDDLAAGKAESGSTALLLQDIVRSVLDRSGGEGWTTREGDFWYHVEPAGVAVRDQGWKLHVSATPLSAPVVLAAAADVLVAARCHFKFAASLAKVSELVSPNVDRGSGGKFITVYPENDEQFRDLAERLHEATRGLPGPEILSDRRLRPGSLVHLRYGVFAGQPVLNNDGSFDSVLVGPDGEHLKDERRAWFSPPPWAVSPVPDVRAMGAATPPTSVLLGDRFEVKEAIKHANTGGVFRATDRETGLDVIVKQARPHVGASLRGTDARDLLRYEARVLDLLESREIAPAKIALFEHQEHLFLAEELIPGKPLRRWLQERTAGPGQRLPLPEVLDVAIQLADLLTETAQAGLVLRDLSPNNIMVTPDGGLKLVDLEHASAPGPVDDGAHTPGYGAPEYLAGSDRAAPAAEWSAVLFALGAIYFYLVSGSDPVATPDKPFRAHRDRMRELVAQVAAENADAGDFCAIVRGLTGDDPANRLSIEQVRDRLLAARDGTAATMRRDPLQRGDSRLPVELQDRLLADGLTYLLRSMTPDGPRLWTQSGYGATADPCNVQYGAAGVLAVLARAAGVYPGDARIRDGVRTVAGWIDSRLEISRLLPGLYFGRSGTAWAQYDAARVLGDTQMADRAIDLAKAVPLEWGNPDICHGVAGAGMAQLHLWQQTADPALRARLGVAADAMLVAAQVRDGHTVWPIATDLDSPLAGLVHYGFAHGVAGIGAFLLAAARATDEPRYLDAALAAGATLVAVAEVDGDTAAWADAPGADPAAQHMWHWCSGASGVGTFLVRLWQVTGDTRYLELARKAAETVHRQKWSAGSSVCHGLAGDGEFLLDLADATGDPRYHAWAEELAALIHLRRGTRDGLLVVGAEDPLHVTPGYGTGLAGVLGFLLRLRHAGARWWMVDAPDVGFVRPREKTLLASA